MELRLRKSLLDNLYYALRVAFFNEDEIYHMIVNFNSQSSKSKLNQLKKE